VDAPRLHHQWLPDVLFAEPYALSPDTQAELARMGYRIVTQAPWSAVELIAADPATTLPPPLAASGRRETMGDDAVAGHEAAAAVYAGANDPRRPAGAAVAP
jgi:gamma-glutamyltranspeptidase/glutathione hydrolase